MGSSKGKDIKPTMDSGKYARYTAEQVEILERVYNECPKPSSARRQQLIRECPILAHIGQKQLKVWFQNRRCREKQHKETCRLQSWASKLNAMHQLLLEENDRLQKQAANLNIENHLLRQQLSLQHPHVDLKHGVPAMNAYDTSSESVVTSSRQHHCSPQHAPQGWSVSQLLAMAEMILAEFLTKASGGITNGIPLPGMKPGPDSTGTVALPRPGGAVAAQACDLVDLGALKVADTVKNKPSWLEDCRKQVIVASLPADRGAIIELVHTQMYTPTPTVAARDFWTLRYTCFLENGNLVVCEGSLAEDQGRPDVPNLPGFIRAEMLPSGVLIRPCEQGGSMVMVVDDLKFMSGSLSDGLRPLYETSAILAWRVTSKILCHLRGLAGELSEIGVANRQVSLVKGFTHRLMRSFNDAISCFPDDGWMAVVNDASSAISVHINPIQSPKQFNSKGQGTTEKGGFICAKASWPLHNMSPSTVMLLLMEHWKRWSDVNGDIDPIDLSMENVHDMPMPQKKFSVVKAFRPAMGQKEMLEVIRFHKLQEPTATDAYQGDSFMLQLCSDIDTAADTHAQLIFAHIDASMPDDAQLLSSGFRIMPSSAFLGTSASSQTLDLASSLEDRSTACRSMESNPVLLTVVLQYPFEIQTRDVVALKAQRNVQSALDFFQQAALSLHPPCALPVKSSQSGMEALLLVQDLSNSYRIYFGQELLPGSDGNAAGLFKLFWSFQPAIICCAWKPLPEFVLANNSALAMLETTTSDLGEMSLDRIFKDGSRTTDYSQPPSFLKKEGFAHLPAGVCLTSTGRPASYERAMGWKVITGDQGGQVVAFLFLNWSLR